MQDIYMKDLYIVNRYFFLISVCNCVVILSVDIEQVLNRSFFSVINVLLHFWTLEGRQLSSRAVVLCSIATNPVH